MESRNFRIDTEWNMIHYPNKPSGFGILIIGDERHFVDEKSSFWTQNEGKLALINDLTERGYTVFYSNLYGKNWGSDKAVQMARLLYEHIIRTEIINEKIHLIAEGMGSLAALKLMHKMGHLIRSAVLLNPVLSLHHHLEQEKEHKFFYKNLLNELSYSYESPSKHFVEEIIDRRTLLTDNLQKPIKIIHILSGGRAYKQSGLLKELSVKWKDENAPISICYLVPEKKQRIRMQITDFMKKHEKVL